MIVLALSRLSRVRWWNQRERAWRRRRQFSRWRGVAGRVRVLEGGGEQAPDLRDGQRDHPGIWRRLAGPHWRGRLGIGAVVEQGRGDCADRQGGHHQHEVAEDRGIEPGLGLVQAEAVLAASPAAELGVSAR